MRGLPAALVLIAASVSAASPIAAAASEPLAADLSNHVVAITTGFTGTSLVLFGSREEPGDIVIVVRGPAVRMALRRRHHVLGFWINTESATFDGAPAFYATISNRPLAQIASAPILTLHQIGIENLRPHVHSPRDLGPGRAADYRAALVRRQQRARRYLDQVGTIAFIGDHLFRTTVAFPANVPVGKYSVEIFLFRDGALVAGQTVPLTVTEAGVDSSVSQFAQDEALIYGMIAVAATAMAGWLASLPFRNR